MPIARFQMPDGRIGRFEVPEGTTPEQAQSLIQSSIAEQTLPPPSRPAPITKTKQNTDSLLEIAYKDIKDRFDTGTLLRPQEESFVRKTLQGASSGPLMGMIQQGASMLGNQELADKIAKNAKEGNFVGALLQPEMMLTGGVAGNFIGQGANVLTKGLRAALPGAVYGATSAVTDAGNQGLERAKQAAITGGISFVSPALLNAAGRGAGWAIDLLKGRLSDIRAGKVLRDTAGEELPKIQAALNAAGADVNAAQAAAPVGSTRWSALGKRAAGQDSQFNADLMARQAADREQKIAALAGGNTQTQARQAVASTKDTLNGLTTPMRDVELNAANTAGDVMRRLTPVIDQKQQSMVSALQGKGMTRTEAAQAGVRNVEGKAGFLSNGDRAQEFGAAAGDFGIIKGQRQAERDFVQRQIDSLQAHGLTPLNTDNIVSAITKKLNDPKLAGSKPIQNVMSNVADEIQAWTKANGGIIDAEALYSIRKNAISNEVSRLNPGATEKTQAKMTAGILNRVNPLIDDAIEAAGGTGWRDYLKTYADGMKVINQMKLGSKALEALNQSPESFMKLASGNNPKVVQKIFGTEYDIAKAMGEKNLPIQEVASELSRDKNLSNLAAAGMTDLSKVLENDALKLRLPMFLNRYATLTNAGLDIAEEALNKKTMAKVYNAMRNGKDASALMNQLSTAEQTAVLKAMINGNLSPYLNSSIVSGAQQ